MSQYFIDKGYGIETEQCELLPDAAYRLLSEHMPEKITEAFASDMEGFGLTEQTAAVFADSYESRTGAGCGFWAVLCDIINEERDLSAHPFIYNDDCVYVQACVPTDYKDKELMLTQTHIRTILHEYLMCICGSAFVSRVTLCHELEICVKL